MRWSLVYFAAAIALAAPIGIAHAAARKESGQKIPAIVVPIDFETYETLAVGKFVPLANVSAEAQVRLEHSMKLALARVGAFTPLSLPTLSAAETAALEEHLDSIKLNVSARVYGKDSLVYTIGPGLQFLADRTGTDLLIFMFGHKFVTGPSAIPIPLAAWSGSVPIPLNNTQLFVAIIELRTGRIRWMNSRNNINADVTKPGGANAYMLPTFGEYPKSAFKMSATSTSSSAVMNWKDHITPFEMTLPPAWGRVEPAPHETLRLSHRSRLIDGIVFDRVPFTAGSATDPIEIANFTVKRMKSIKGYEKLEIERIEPATVAGLQGFRAELRFRREHPFAGGGNFRLRMYGMIRESKLYLLHLEALDGAYFDEAAPAFEKMVTTVNFGSTRVKRR